MTCFLGTLALLVAPASAADDVSSSPPAAPAPTTEAGTLPPAPQPTMDPTPVLFGMVPSPASVVLGGFADVGFVGTNNLAKNDFVVGQLVVHSIATMPNGFSAFAEVSVNSSPAWETRVERMLLSWEHSDALKLSVGRHHIPVTWWNSTFHHGLWLQTSARRPLIIGYNDAFIPNHAVGLVATGLVPVARPLGLRYEVAVTGGGDDHKHSGAVDEMPRIAWTGGLSIEPQAVPHLRLGAVSYRDPHRMRGDMMVRETLTGVHLAYTSEQPELLAECVRVAHAVLEPGADSASDAGLLSEHASYGGYVQVGWRLPVGAQRLKPYLRTERMLVDATDPSLTSSVRQDLHTLGVRYDLSDTFALKVEGAYRSPAEAAATFEGLSQVSASW